MVLSVMLFAFSILGSPLVNLVVKFVNGLWTEWEFDTFVLCCEPCPEIFNPAVN